MWEKKPTDTRDSPAASVENCADAGCPLAAHRGPQWNTYPLCLKKLQPMGIPRSWQDLLLVRDPCWSSPLLKDCTLWRSFMLEEFLKNCNPWQGPTLKKFMKDYILWEELHPGV